MEIVIYILEAQVTLPKILVRWGLPDRKIHGSLAIATGQNGRGLLLLDVIKIRHQPAEVMLAVVSELVLLLAAVSADEHSIDVRYLVEKIQRVVVTSVGANESWHTDSVADVSLRPERTCAAR